MKLFCPALSVAALVLAVAQPAQSAEVTLTVNPHERNGRTNMVDQVEVATNEVAEVTTFLRWTGGPASGDITVVKNGITNAYSTFNGASMSNDGLPLRVAGPAVIRLVSNPAVSLPAFCTIRITPESFPPDKSIIVPAGTGANIALESSTDLIHWQSAVPGVYTNREQNLIFRIKADRTALQP